MKCPPSHTVASRVGDAGCNLVDLIRAREAALPAHDQCWRHNGAELRPKGLAELPRVGDHLGEYCRVEAWLPAALAILPIPLPDVVVGHRRVDRDQRPARLLVYGCSAAGVGPCLKGL